jgi:tetratricopeptide (TPR) repeat protein
MIDLHEKLYKRVKDEKLASINIGNLGLVYWQIGQIQKSIQCTEYILSESRKSKNKRNESSALTNLGIAYNSLGEVRKAIEFHEQALVISREIGNRESEGADLCSLGNRYLILDDAYKAIEFYKQSLAISREFGNRRSESIDIENIGNAFLSLEEYQKAKDNYQQAIQIADKISFLQVLNYAYCGLAETYLFENNLTNAHATIEAALQYDVPENNHNASALHGIIALRQGDEVAARGAFLRAIGQADEILSKTAEYYSALDAKGLSICGLAICDGRGAASYPKSVPAPDDAPTNNTGRGDPAPTVNDAIETFRKARKIAPHAGVVKSVLQLFDELVKCDEEGILKDVRIAVEGK